MAGADVVWDFLLAKRHAQEFVPKWKADLAAADAAEGEVFMETLAVCRT